MYKDINSKWNFAEMPSNIPSRSGEDSTFDHFRRDTSRFIIREFIQNSLDAPIDTTGKIPVKVTFSSGELLCSDYPELIGSLKDRMLACQKTCDENENSRNPYGNKVAYLESIEGKHLPYFVVADYGTKGMEYSDSGQSSFNAGVRQMGASHKKGNGHAGGSHGLGKTVGFVASELNAVYYSTMVEDNSTFGEGVIRLCVHKYKNKEYFSDAFYDSHGGKRPDSAFCIPEEFRRKEMGTSVYILGMQPSEDELTLMKQEVLRSFWLAIYHNKLIVEIGGETFSNENIQAKMLEYFTDDDYGKFDRKIHQRIIEKFNPRPYFFDCVLNYSEDDSHFKFEANNVAYPTLEHAVLYVYKDESIKDYSEDRIICMRDKEMVIEFQQFLTHKGYYAVLICDGEGSQYLRKMENVTHDKWDKNEVKELDQLTKSNAHLVLKEIKAFLESSISSIFPIADDTEYKVPVLNRYIVAAGNTKMSLEEGNSNYGINSDNDPQTPVTTTSTPYKDRRVYSDNTGRVVVRKKKGAKKSKRKSVVPGGLNVSSQPVPAPVTGSPTLPTQPSMPSENPTTTNPEPKALGNPITGKLGNDTGKNGMHETSSKGNHVEAIDTEFRVVPVPTDNGLIHRIIIDSDADYKSCSMAITIAGADNDTTLRFTSINTDYKIVGKNCNILSEFDLCKGKNYIDIKFEDDDYHSLNIKAYEN